MFDTCVMLNAAKLVLLFASLAFAISGLRPGLAANAVPQETPQYTSDGQLKFPEQYRTWVFLSAGMDMSYAGDAQTGNMHMFENVFVNAAAYESFQKTGTWPDKTTLVTEFRDAQGKGSINKHGRFQTDLMGYDVHVKDAKRFPGKWGFFGFNPGSKSSALIPATAACYTCHADHAAVDTTFVQFYPTLLPIAKRKGTLSSAYKKEN
jgi:hypothetical protein